LLQLQSHKIPKHSELYKELLSKAKQRCGRIGDAADDCDAEVCRTTATTTDASEAVGGSEAVSSCGGSQAITPTVDATDASVAVGDTYEQTKSPGDSVLEVEMNKFYRWLTSVDGDLKHSKSTKQHVAQVELS